MSTGDKNIPLHKKTHWRRFKELVKEVAEYEKIDLENYDLSKITCFETIGDGLKGSNVTYSTKDKSSCWVSDNKYYVYEIPSKSNFNKYSFTGNFIFAACNKSFNDDWIIGTMSANINYAETKKQKYIVENIHYAPCGKYSVVFGDTVSDISIKKNKKGTDLNYGAHVHNESKFDAWGIRKFAYTHKSSSDILSEILGKNKENKITSETKVKKYKKHK